MSKNSIKKLTVFSNASERSSSDKSRKYNQENGFIEIGIITDNLANKVSKECRRLISRLKKQCPEHFPESPLNEGEISAPIHIDKQSLTRLFRLALQPAKQLSSTNKNPKPNNDPVIWQLDEAQVFFYPDKTKVEIADGLILVGIVLESVQTGQATLTVAFATGRNGQLSGTVMTTEEHPRGPELLVNIWGDAVIAAAYDAVLQVTNGIAAEVGNDLQGQVLRAGAIVTTKKGLGVIPQAYHSFENTIRGKFQPNIPISVLGKNKKTPIRTNKTKSTTNKRAKP